MYTNPKPHVMPDYAKAPLLSRASLLFSAVMLVGAVSGGLLGLFNARSYPAVAASTPAAIPASSSSAASDTAANARIAISSRGSR